MEIVIPSLAALAAAAQEFAAALGESRVVAFYGAMGAGKTTFIKALCEALGVQDVITSPTFAIVNEYLSGSDAVYHCDCYRLRSAAEFLDLGGEDYLYSGHLCLIEWPEVIEELLPAQTCRVSIVARDDGCRIVTLLPPEP